MNTLPFLPANSVRISLFFLVLAGTSTNSGWLHAQTAPAKPVAPAASPTGFSIESEMLTYRALESNSKAIACDVASYLNGNVANYKSRTPTAAPACTTAGSGSGIRNDVIVLPFDRSAFADFQAWRSAMQTMTDFNKRGHCTASATSATSGQSGNKAELKTEGAVDTLLSLTPVGGFVSAASGVLGLFASDYATSPVGGTIQDQAFIDNVSRELLAVNIPVLMPTAYTPYALTSINSDQSPFYVAFEKLLDTRNCLYNANHNDDGVKNIDLFINTLRGSATPVKPVTPPVPGTTDPSSIPTASSTPPLEAVLSGDGLAQRLHADPATGVIPDPGSHHILMIKALESGGSVNRFTYILGTKISYSGGSVGTYALFNLNGQLECSGNVYDYTGPLPSKKFEKQLRAVTPDPSTQVIFQDGGCRPLR